MVIASGPVLFCAYADYRHGAALFFALITKPLHMYRVIDRLVAPGALGP